MNIKKALMSMLLAAVAAVIPGCSIGRALPDSMMADISANPVGGKPSDDLFVSSMADFSIELFKKSLSDKNENSLVSPVSVMLALAMTANGAGSETLAQMERLLGGGIPLADLNEYLYNFAKSLPSGNKSKLNIANSIWFRDDGERLQVEPTFLQTNADYYGASAYKSAFDAQTLKAINNWVSQNTDGMIDSILGEINENAVLYLINAVVFDAQWQSAYKDYDVRKGDFTDINGAVLNVDFMHSAESRYLDDGRATGFVKPYHSGGYSFAALLPNKGVGIAEYAASLTGAGFVAALKNAQGETVFASMPKFKYEYAISLNDALKALGIPDAFDGSKADFGRMASSAAGNICISDVFHKTFIEVDELGTKAGAATIVTMEDGAMPPPPDPKTVRLDRPFVYAIIDNATNLPVFIGTVLTVG